MPPKRSFLKRGTKPLPKNYRGLGRKYRRGIKMDKRNEMIEELSQKLFGKDSKDIKYIMVTDFIHDQLVKEGFIRTGLYNWVQTFDGTINIPGNVDFNEYDIVHINMSKQDRYLPTYIRSKLKPDSKTIIVANNDYTSELWEGIMEHPSIQKKFYEDADVLFGTEYYQSSALAHITGKKVYCIPHPTNTKLLNEKHNKVKKPYVAVIWRRYDRNAYVPFLAIKDLGLKTVLVGYDRSKDPNWSTTESLYDNIVPHTSYEGFLKILNEAAIVYNPYTLHSYDRTGVDCAAMGIPMVGSDRSWSMRKCYKETMCDAFDVTKAEYLIKKTLTQPNFYKEVTDNAMERAEYFNQENAKLRFLTAIYDSKNGQSFKGVVEFDDDYGDEKDAPEQCEESNTTE